MVFNVAVMPLTIDDVLCPMQWCLVSCRVNALLDGSFVYTALMVFYVSICIILGRLSYC